MNAPSGYQKEASDHLTLIDFDINITSRTERVYTRTFVLVTEEES